MIVEGESTKCPSCKRSLTWQSHVKRWEDGEEVEEFTFSCDTCKREFLFKDNQIIEKGQGRDPHAEALAIRRSQLQAAANRRCMKCGGPIRVMGSSALHCQWCRQEYAIVDGELQLRIHDSVQRKFVLREFHAFYH